MYTDGLQVLHHCDNPPCIRVSHLFTGTNDDNMADKKAKGRTSKAGGRKRSLSVDLVVDIKSMLSQGISISETHRTTGVSYGTVQRISAGELYDDVKAGCDF